jgi:PAS domain S-box-containing protein
MADETKNSTAPHVTGKVLVVDDDPVIAEILTRILTSSGYRCVIAEDGLQAVSRLQADNFNFIISDIEMPNMDGFELLQYARENCPDTAMIIATGYGDKYHYADVIKRGAADYLNKPVDREELLAKLDRLRREQEIVSALKHETLTMQALADLMLLSVGGLSLQETLKKFLDKIVSFAWLDLEPKGAIFTTDKNGEALRLMAHYNLAEPLQTTCALVPFGRCLCGRSARDKEVLFCSTVDERHDNTYEGILPHGHYCIPIKTEENELLGVFTVYTREGAERNSHVEKILMGAAAAAAKLIKTFQVEEELKKKDFQHRAITDNTIDAIIMMDSRGRVSFWNPAAEKIFGYTEEEALNKDLHPLLLPHSLRNSYQDALQLFFQTGQGKSLYRTVETTGRHKDGREIPIELSLTPLQVDNEWNAIGIVRDISARKEQEREKEKIEKMLRQSQKLEAIGTLAGGIAHDFNNLLATIIGFAELSKDDTDKESQLYKDLDRILTAGQQAKGLIHQILTFSRQSEQESIPMRPHIITKETVKLLRAAIPANIEIRQEIDPRCDSILADPSKMHQVIMNLAVNAGYAMRKQGDELFIGLSNIEVDESLALSVPELQPKKYVRLTVRDNGHGMDTACLERIFEPYFTTKPQGEGSGLGLSTVHGIVNEMGGAITVKSAPGEGTVFDVYFPSLAAPAKKTAPRTEETAPARKERILYVDDEPSLVEISLKSLSRKGYRVSGRTSSIEALEAFRAQPDNYDLVITDYAMPQMTGLELARQIMQIRIDVPVILITGFGDSETTDEALKAGIRKIVFKPVILGELDQSIREIFNEQPSGQDISQQ